MNRILGLLRWLGTLFIRKRFERELDEEFRFHIERETEENIRRGMEPAEARRVAMRDFGGLERTREQVRDSGTVLGLENLIRDIRYACRRLVKRPGFSTLVIITLSIGIGVTTAIFSVVNGVLLRPLPHPDPDRLVRIFEVDSRSRPPGKHILVTPANFLDWRDQNRVFQSIAAFSLPSELMIQSDQHAWLRQGVVTEDFFSVLKVEPQIGRLFSRREYEYGKSNVAIISHGLWHRVFNGDPSIIGKLIRLTSRSPIIIGVMPEGFDFLAADVDLWGPRVFRPEEYQDRRHHNYSVVARLRDGISIDQARQSMDELVSRIRIKTPETMTGWGVNIEPLEETIVGGIRPALLVLLGAVSLLLIIACANVANLMLIRNSARVREIAVRAALGAGRGRLIRESLVECIVLAVVGGVIGTSLAVIGTNALLAAAPGILPRLDEVGIDSSVLLFALLISVLTGLLFGLAPTISVSRLNIKDSLKFGSIFKHRGFSHIRLMKALVVPEIAITLILMIGAGLLTRTFLRLISIDPGFDAKNVLKMTAYLWSPEYESVSLQNAFHSQAIQKIENLPSVLSVGTTRYLPILQYESTYNFYVEGRNTTPGGKLEVGLQPVDAGYFKTMGIPILKGRGFTEYDTADMPPVLMINETMARQFFGEDDPIGKRGRIWYEDEPLREIIGVVADVKHYGLASESSPTIYQPITQTWDWLGSQMTFVVRTASDPSLLGPAIRHIFHDIDEDIPVMNLDTMQSVIARSVAERRFSMFLLILFATVAAILAIVGIYSVVSSATNQQVYEIGMRIALGASPTAIKWLVTFQGIVLALIGGGVGIIGALISGRFLSSMLFEISSADPLTYCGLFLLLIVVTAVASYFPASRASCVNPMETLRAQ